MPLEHGHVYRDPAPTAWRAQLGLAALETEEFARRRSSEEFEPYLRSPIHHLQSSGEVRFRRRHDTCVSYEFPVLADLRAAGMTDDAARALPFDDGQTATLRAVAVVEGVERPNLMQGIFFSCTTDAEGGFDEGQLQQVEDLLPYLALAVKSRSMFEVARTLLEAYLGPDAGRRVLTGAIDRHSVQGIQAVIWLCDLRGFSEVASRVPQEELVEILSAYLDVMARPVLDNRCQILKFMGDGFLATCDLEQRSRQAACIDALKAAEQLVETFPRFNAERLAAGKSTLDFAIALHIGEVLYGNIGTNGRLDFTLVGSAVNEASRIEALCKRLKRKVLVFFANKRPLRSNQHRFRTQVDIALNSRVQCG